MMREITIRNKPSELQRVANFVEEIGGELGIDGELLMNLNLALEEMVSNIIHYAHPQQSDDCIALKAESDGAEIIFTLADQGIEFDPTQKGHLDTDANPAERELGGMGIFIVKNIMNKVTYQRTAGQNVVTLVKRLTGEKVKI